MNEYMLSLKKKLDKLTDDERAELFKFYCKYCGCKDPSCQCRNCD